MSYISYVVYFLKIQRITSRKIPCHFDITRSNLIAPTAICTTGCRRLSWKFPPATTTFPATGLQTGASPTSHIFARLYGKLRAYTFTMATCVCVFLSCLDSLSAPPRQDAQRRPATYTCAHTQATEHTYTLAW